MDQGVRKFAVGFIALGALVGIFVCYARLHETLPVATEARGIPPEWESDANAVAAGDQGGTILGTDVRRVEQTQFFHTNERSQVDREFGFEELLHQQGDQWEITKPYMRVFLPAFRCEVTADRGKVRLETAFGRAVPSDAAFSGNVIIHIVPTEPDDPWESFIRLDDVGFVADKSLFSTLGPVRFFSRNAQLTGTGMEMLYDALRSRLELFRIFDLESLRLRSSAFGSVAGLTDPAPARRTGGDPSDQGPVGPGGTANVYQCVFRRNVTIDTPERTVAAEDGLSIHGILWSQAGAERTGPQASRPTAPTPDRSDARPPAGPPHSGPADRGAGIRSSGPGARPHSGPLGREEDGSPDPQASSPATAPAALDTRVSSYQDLESMPREFFDIVVTCDGGFWIAPMDSGERGARTISDSGLRIGDSSRGANPPSAATGRPETLRVGQYTTARHIDFDATTKDTTLAGPVEMMFYVDPNALNDQQAGHEMMPMTISAQQSVRFLAVLNQVLLEGDCTAALRRAEPNVTYKYTLTAPRFTLDLAPRDEGESLAPRSADRVPAPESAVTIHRFTASGGPSGRDAPDARSPGRGAVGLQIFRRGLDKQLLGWTKLDAAQLQYDAGPQEFLATGPGVLWLHNAEIINAQTDPNQFSLGRPCYACLNNFDALRYSLSTGRISAEARSQQLLLDYFPLTSTGYGRHIQAVAGHVEALLRPAAGPEDGARSGGPLPRSAAARRGDRATGRPGVGESPAGRLNLAELTASKGIDFEDEKYHFVGSVLHYDGDKDLITVQGDRVQPCMLNGALVDQIEMNLKTGYINAPVSAPSILQVR